MKHIKHGNTMYYLSTTCIMRHMTFLYAAFWKKHLNASHQKEKGHTLPHLSAPPFSPLLPLYMISQQQPPAVGIQIFQGVSEVYPIVLPMEKRGYSLMQTRGKHGLQCFSDFVNPTMPYPAVSFSRQVSLLQLLEHTKYAPSLLYAQQPNASLAKLLAL